MFVGCILKKDDKSTHGHQYSNEIVIIELTQEAFDSGKEYSVEDFPELSLSQIVQSKMINRDGHVEKLYPYYSLYLKEPSHQNVENAISVVKKRSDVKNAGRRRISYCKKCDS